MTLEHTIQSMFDHYPYIFQDRTDCLNHLFCALGNGCEWQNGELIEDGLPAPVHDLVNGQACQHQTLTVRTAAILGARIWATQTGETVDESRFAHLPDTPRPQKPRRQRWYFVHRRAANKPETINLYKDYVPLWNVPPDAKADWLAGISECLHMLLEDGVIQPSDVNIGLNLSRKNMTA